MLHLVALLGALEISGVVLLQKLQEKDCQFFLLLWHAAYLRKATTTYSLNWAENLGTT